MSNVIKRIDARTAWIQIDDNTAKLVVFDKDTTATKMAEHGDKMIARRERRAAIKQRIEELKRNGISY